jgi:MFS family permease
VFALAIAWPLILLGRAAGWLGRGIRGPLRDAMLADSVDSKDRGKAFGFHRAGDTAGAVLGPLVAFSILTWASSNSAIVERVNSWLPLGAAAPGGAFRLIFLLTLVPGLFSVLSMVFLVTEKRRPRNDEMKFMTTLRGMPRSYRNFLLGVGLFGLADFAPTLMILRATTVLEPALGLLDASRYAALLYLIRNVAYALASYPIGALSDRFPRTRYLAAGYAVAVVTFIGFAVALPSIWWFVGCFVLAGVFIAWEDTIEGVAVRDYVPPSVAGTAYGVLGTVNGVGDFASSLIVGVLWTSFGAVWGFAYAVIVGAAGMVLMALTKRPSAPVGTTVTDPRAAATE